jgi:phage portal protein BeeE
MQVLYCSISMDYIESLKQSTAFIFRVSSSPVFDPDDETYAIQHSVASQKTWIFMVTLVTLK